MDCTKKFIRESAISENKYGVIYVDAPWDFKCRSEKGMGRSAQNHYKCLSIQDIMNLPVRDYAADDCVLLMWATDPFLEIAFKIIKAWGFKYKTVGFYWAKLNKNANVEQLSIEDFFMGTGYWTRANPEQCLLATIGNPKRKAKDVRKLIISPRRQHSRKPDEAYSRIERLLPGPYLELFARNTRPGWTSMGDEMNKYDSTTFGLQ